ncbi:MAG: thiamine pyrophosphate-binding protein [Candidatus Binatia bacterium]
MRKLVHDYLSKRVSRREFLHRMARSGFSLAAATSVLDSLTPLLDAEAASPASEGAKPDVTVVEGTGGRLLVEQLRAAGARFIFNCNSSGTYPVFDALVERPDMQVIEVLQEGQMVSVAQGYALGSGEIAFTLNDSGGFPNTLSNMFNAWRDQTPIVVGSEREASDLQGGRGAYEEWDDFLSPSSSFTRWRWSVEGADRIPEITRRAFTIASTAPEGPVALAFPRNVLAATGVRATIIDRAKFIIAPKVTPNPALVEQAARLLLEAESPLLLVGPEVTRSGAEAAVIALAERLAMPVTQGKSLFADFPTNHPLFLGNYTAPPRYPLAIDLLLNLGASMPYERDAIPPRARVIHVSIDADQIGRVVPTDVGIVASVRETAMDLRAALESLVTKARLDEMGSARLGPIRAATDAIRAGQARVVRAQWDASPLRWERVAGELDQLLEPDAIIVSELTNQRWDIGDFGLPASSFAQNTGLSQFTFAPGGKTRIGKSTGGALGWGVGAAIGVKLARRDRQVVALQGDGGFLFGQAESLWTMVRYKVPVIVVIFNNRSYNGPRNQIFRAGEQQARTGKDMTCYLGDPDVDFAKIAVAFGVKGETVTTAGQVKPAIQRAIASTRDGRPYLIDAVVARTGAGADSAWYPRYSVAAGRTRKV